MPNAISKTPHPNQHASNTKHQTPDPKPQTTNSKPQTPNLQTTKPLRPQTTKLNPPDLTKKLKLQTQCWKLKHESPRSEFETWNPKPQTRKPKREIRNPKVSRFFRNHHYGSFLVANLCQHFEERGNGNYDSSILFHQVSFDTDEQMIWFRCTDDLISRNRWFNADQNIPLIVIRVWRWSMRALTKCYKGPN